MATALSIWGRPLRIDLTYNAGEVEPPDQAMLDRLEVLAEEGELPVAHDRAYLVHECTEDRILREHQEAAHDAIRRRHGDYANYAPEVVEEFPDYFNSNWRREVGLE